MKIKGEMDMSKSTKFKKSITMVLTLLLLVASIPSYGASLRFSDVAKKHWAYDYIEDMVGLKYLNGYPNGTFGPEGNLTLMEAISTLSRFSEPSSAERSKANSGYASLLDELEISQDWQKEGLAIGLFKDILTEKEVREDKNLLGKPINRERVAELLVKAMGLEDIANSIEVVYVDYKDISEVSSGRRKYLRVLLDAGILDPNGKGNKEFKPEDNLTRAEMAKMLSEGASYLKKNPPKAEVIEYEYITDIIKRITVDAGTMLVIENKPDREKGYRADGATISIDGKQADIKSLSEGQEVRLKVEKDTINLVSIEAFSAEETISGVAKYVSTVNDKISLEYKDDKKILTKEYSVDSKARIYLNGKVATLKDLKDGDLVELKVKNNIINEIEAVSKDIKALGSLVEIVPIKEGKETSYLITIKEKEEKDKERVTHTFSTDSRTDFYRKDRRVTGDELRLKDEIYIEGEYNLAEDVFIAKLVDAKTVMSKVKGQVTETTKRVNKHTLVTLISRETKEEESYELANNVEIIIDGTKSSSLPADPGYYAELDLEGDEIIKINVDTKMAEESISGKVIDMNYRDKTIYLQDNSVNYDSSKENDYIIIYTTDKTLFTRANLTKASFDSLKMGDIIIVGGVYKDKNFEANLVLIR